MAVKRKKFTKVPPEISIKDLSPWNISCGSTKCEDNLHCFRLTKSQIKKNGSSGFCKTCNQKLIDWERVQKRDSKDAMYIFQELKKELIRHVYFHNPIKQEDIDKAIKDGKEKIQEKIIQRLTNVIGIAEPWRKGYTPYTGDIVYYGQHATATCCRRCMEYWYNIPQGRPLTYTEINFAKDLILLYIKERLPSIL